MRAFGGRTQRGRDRDLAASDASIAHPRGPRGGGGPVLRGQRQRQGHPHESQAAFGGHASLVWPLGATVASLTRAMGSGRPSPACPREGASTNGHSRATPPNPGHAPLRLPVGSFSWPADRSFGRRSARQPCTRAPRTVPRLGAAPHRGTRSKPDGPITKTLRPLGRPTPHPQDQRASATGTRQHHAFALIDAWTPCRGGAGRRHNRRSRLAIARPHGGHQRHPPRTDAGRARDRLSSVDVMRCVFAQRLEGSHAASSAWCLATSLRRLCCDGQLWLSRRGAGLGVQVLVLALDSASQRWR